MSEIALPKSLYALVLASVIDDVDVVEHCLSIYPDLTTQCLPHALRHMLTPLANQYNIDVQILTGKQAAKMLYIIWQFSKIGRYEMLHQAVTDGLIHVLPYIFSLNADIPLMRGTRTLIGHPTANGTIGEIIQYNRYLIVKTAILSGNLAITQFFISYMKSRDIYPTNDILLGIAICSCCSLDMIKLLVSDNPSSSINLADLFYYPSIAPEHHNGESVVPYIDISVVRWLVKEKANLSPTNMINDTALISAARCDRLDLVNLFLEAKCDVNEQQGRTLLRAVATGTLDIVTRLLESKANVYEYTGTLINALLDCNPDKCIRIMPLLLNPLGGQKGFNINYHDGFPIYRAIEEDSPHIVEMLLAAGAEIGNLRDIPISPEILQILTKYGYNVVPIG